MKLRWSSIDIISRNQRNDYLFYSLSIFCISAFEKLPFLMMSMYFVSFFLLAFTHKYFFLYVQNNLANLFFKHFTIDKTKLHRLIVKMVIFNFSTNDSMILIIFTSYSSWIRFSRCFKNMSSSCFIFT